KTTTRKAVVGPIAPWRARQTPSRPRPARPPVGRLHSVRKDQGTRGGGRPGRPSTRRRRAGQRGGGGRGRRGGQGGGEGRGGGGSEAVGAEAGGEGTAEGRWGGQLEARGRPCGGRGGRRDESGFAENGVQCPAPPHMRSLPAQVGQDRGVGAAALFEGVGQH